ncbi:TrkA family potassium uptake protein [Ruania suaedae]|uniref:potassium channel family protein n=1 Tax=Ruania suaedae TaxID=2897774 RepID=UPI001E524BA8|nr:TrkA family potassium uptake protein [Ruania suaedae]UFU02946.1 TrkA family potassium uptake protein [Ruania suaedae]
MAGGKSRTSLSPSDSVVVAGLGRFGSALAIELAQAGVDVLGIDTDAEIVQSLSGGLTHVVRADSTKREVLEQLAVPDFTHAVVGIGNDLEASILTASWFVRFGIPTVWAKAITEPHGQILDQLGVHQVVYPESEMGRRVAHLLRGSIADYQDIGGGFAMVTAAVPPSWVGSTIGAIDLRSKHNLNVTAVRKRGGGWVHATEQTVLDWNDTVIVMGPAAKAERFIDMA